MKKLFRYVLPLGLALLLIGCGAGPLPGAGQGEMSGRQALEEERLPSETAGQMTEDALPQAREGTEESEEQTEMRMTINDTAVTVEWESNESVQALRELVKEEKLTVPMSMYGGFEQVGSLGQRLPRNDAQTVTSAGDIVLYSGNQIVVFYGSNAWAYTRLGRITDKSSAQLAELLGKGDVTITIESGRCE